MLEFHLYFFFMFIITFLFYRFYIASLVLLKKIMLFHFTLSLSYILFYFLIYYIVFYFSDQLLIWIIFVLYILSRFVLFIVQFFKIYLVKPCNAYFNIRIYFYKIKYSWKLKDIKLIYIYYFTYKELIQNIDYILEKQKICDSFSYNALYKRG